MTRAEVARLHGQIGDRPYQANRLLAVIGSLYTFAERCGLVPENCNPTRKTRKIPRGPSRAFSDARGVGAPRGGHSRGRDRWHRVARGWRYAEIKTSPEGRKPTHFAVARRRCRASPLIFTGARLREILQLRWEHVDLGRGLLLLPDSKTGRKTIVLNRPALEILQTHPRGGSYVISGSQPDRPRHGSQEALVGRLSARRARRRAVARPATHICVDRRGGKFGLPIVGKLLGHSQAQTTARYAHLDADPLLRAANLIGDRIESAMNPPAATTSPGT